MNKSELITNVAASAGVTKQVATTVVDTVLESIGDSLGAGQDVQIRGFGNFKVTTRAARTGKNPQTGEQMQIPEKQVIKFRPAKDLSDKLG